MAEVPERSARAWDEGSLAAAYRLHSRRLYGTALRLLGRGEDAEDAVHEAFVALTRRPPDLAPDDAGAWLTRVVVNGCLDRIRSRRRWRTDEVNENAVAPLRPVPVGLRIDLERAVSELPDRARTVFLLHDLDGLRHDEIAAALGINEGTSKSQLFRARAILRERLSARGEGA